ncbi:MAG: type II secretion system protein [Planctomycetes bacterium]|nr:type II secretion system protein [Planctomycetota bacterium]MCB9920125.1 type II secretion system protein [Planctomycetota bacterium]
MTTEPAALPPPRSREQGFGLVDSMVAASILVIALTAILQSQISNVKVSTASRARAIATSELRSCMETALAMTIDGILATGSPFVHDQPVAAFTDRALPGEKIVVKFPNYTAPDPVPPVLLIHFEIEWRDPSGMVNSFDAMGALRR